jgi:glycosyltransferase involved in cell wall biosynthesis
MNDRLLVLSRYSRLGASSRLRTLQYEPWLQQAGFDVECDALFDDAYLASIYAGKKKSTDVAKYCAERALRLFRRKDPSLIWIEYEIFPWMPWKIEKFLYPSGVPVVADYDDAVFHRYDLHSRRPVRWALSKKIDHLMRYSELVTGGNHYLIERAGAAGAKNVEFVPTVVDLNVYNVNLKLGETKAPTVGWVGTPETWAAFGADLHSRVSETLHGQNARFKALGGGLTSDTVRTLDVVPWTESSEVAEIQSMDIGVMPLPDTPWARGKCGYKLIQYMACGLPVVASPVGVNSDIVEHGVNGFLATTDAEWNEAITTLLRDPDLRHRMGQAGRKKVEEQYSLQVWGPRVARLLRDAADQGRAS